MPIINKYLKKLTFRHWIYIIIIILVVFCAIQYLSLPDVSHLKEHNPEVTAFMKLRDKEALSKNQIPKRTQVWVPLSKISPYLKRATIIAEDWQFYRHDGIDYQALWEAFKSDLFSLSFKKGASTITMQLAKNLYLSPSRNPIRKIKEFFIAKRLENELNKERILEIYLNIIEWGDGIYGCEAASQAYFHKPCSDLSPQESAMLAATINNPKYENPLLNTQRLFNRTRIILFRMNQ
jgi:monofunctional glycosyltransferase